MVAPIVPFEDEDSNLIHRVSADTNQAWINGYRGKRVSVLMQCGAYAIGRIVEDAVLVTCMVCMARQVREAEWE